MKTLLWHHLVEKGAIGIVVRIWVVSVIVSKRMHSVYTTLALHHLLILQLSLIFLQLNKDLHWRDILQQLLYLYYFWLLHTTLGHCIRLLKELNLFQISPNRISPPNSLCFLFSGFGVRRRGCPNHNRALTASRVRCAWGLFFESANFDLRLDFVIGLFIRLLIWLFFNLTFRRSIIILSPVPPLLVRLVTTLRCLICTPRTPIFSLRVILGGFYRLRNFWARGLRWVWWSYLGRGFLGDRLLILLGFRIPILAILNIFFFAKDALVAASKCALSQELDRWGIGIRGLI